MATKTQPYVRGTSLDSLDDVSLELNRVEEAMSQLANHIATEESTDAPSKVFFLMARFADGVNWNPGQGRGLYIYFDDRWNKISTT